MDGGNVREADPNKHGLKIVDVARRSIEQVDFGEKVVFMPSWGRQAHWIYWLCPSLMEKFASRKYNFWKGITLVQVSHPHLSYFVF